MTVKSRLLVPIKFRLNRKFCSSKSPTFHILNVVANTKKK